MKQDIDAALARLAEAFPQTFVLEKYRPHRPLKVGIAAAIPARCPDVERRVLAAALSAYARRVSGPHFQRPVRPILLQHEGLRECLSEVRQGGVYVLLHGRHPALHR